MAPPEWGSTYPITAYYLFIDLERMKGWVGLVGWPVTDGLPTSGHPSAAGQEPETAPMTIPPTKILANFVAWI